MMEQMRDDMVKEKERLREMYNLELQHKEENHKFDKD